MAGGDMAVDGVVTEVENAILIPFDAHRVIGPVADLRRRLDPVDPRRLFGPEAVGVVDALPIEPVVIGGGAMRVRRSVGGDGNQRFGGG
jgi:hypothetical protein